MLYMLVSKFCKYDLIVKNKFWFILSYTMSFCLCCFTSLAFTSQLHQLASVDIIFFNFLELHSVFLKKDFHYIFPLMNSHSLLTVSPPHTHTHHTNTHTHTHTHTPKQPKSANHCVIKVFFSILPLHLQHYMYCKIVLLMLVWYFLQIFLQSF